ncbi:hypothetical protein P280DRAFT_538995 [Massarina eburnea CBS 473.64]|uniref:Uncharacterized protein n=1 Tax=Massarina eburnea CBS 473.64 TaxID=1395130 RepID=A0A6A6S787_9PLEO|nr:hypothetical protein P280DRAFT_538995 [Massarina eburnea CBS 473.64]
MSPNKQKQELDNQISDLDTNPRLRAVFQYEMTQLAKEIARLTIESSIPPARHVQNPQDPASYVPECLLRMPLLLQPGALMAYRDLLKARYVIDAENPTRMPGVWVNDVLPFDVGKEWMGSYPKGARAVVGRRDERADSGAGEMGGEIGGLGGRDVCECGVGGEMETVGGGREGGVVAVDWALKGGLKPRLVYTAEDTVGVDGEKDDDARGGIKGLTKSFAAIGRLTDAVYKRCKHKKEDREEGDDDERSLLGEITLDGGEGNDMAECEEAVGERRDD